MVTHINLLLERINKSALFNLAEFYKENLGSYRLAYDLFKRAADLNHDKSCIELSKMYINGQDVKKDEAMAKHYFEKAVDVSSTDGRLLLAQMCIDGDALDKDLEYAEHLIFEVIKEDKTNDALLFYFEKLIKKEISIINESIILVKGYLKSAFDNENRISIEEHKILEQIIQQTLLDRISVYFGKELKDLQ